MNRFYKEKEDIIDWLDKYKVKNYTLIPDGKYGFVVNVEGDVYLAHKNLSFIPVKFGNVVGILQCGHNKLKSLEFCPSSVGMGLYCNNNKLESLEFSPASVGGSFSCSSNQLISLEFCPQYVGGSFYCDSNPNLEKIQKITDFKEVCLKHREFLIEKFSDKLDNSLNHVETEKKQNKIKL